MTRNRWTGLAGLLFGIVFFGGVITAGTTPSSNGSGAVERYVKYWSDSSHQNRATASAFILTYALVLLIAFAAGLRDRLRAVDTGPLPSLVLAGGTAAATLIAVGSQVTNLVGVTAKASSAYKPDGSALLFETLGYALLAPAIMAAGAMAVATGVITLRTRVLPVWTAWLGFLVGLAGIGSLFTAWTGFILLPLWCAVVGVVLLMRSDDAEAPVAA